MSRSTIHFARQRSKKVKSRLFKGGAGSDARGRKGRHLLLEGVLEGSLTSDAMIDNGLAGLESLEHPDRLPELRQDVLRPGVAFVDLEGSNEGFHVSVVSWKDHRILRLIIDVSVKNTAADADKSVVADEGVEGPQPRRLAGHFLSRVGSISTRLLQVF